MIEYMIEYMGMIMHGHNLAHKWKEAQWTK